MTYFVTFFFFCNAYNAGIASATHVTTWLDATTSRASQLKQKTVVSASEGRGVTPGAQQRVSNRGNKLDGEFFFFFQRCVPANAEVDTGEGNLAVSRGGKPEATQVRHFRETAARPSSRRRPIGGSVH